MEQNLVTLANDDSAEVTTFKTQHYWYNGPFTASGGDYPAIMIYIGGDAAAMIK